MKTPVPFRHGIGLQPDSSTGVDLISRLTGKIGGSPSLDQQFSNGKNPFNISITECDKQQKLKNRGSR